MEYCDGGSVKDIMTQANKPLSEKVVAYITAQVLLGLSYLHQINVLHRNIKASNILLTSDGFVKLGMILASLFNLNYANINMPQVMLDLQIQHSQARILPGMPPRLHSLESPRRYTPSSLLCH